MLPRAIARRRSLLLAVVITCWFFWYFSRPEHQNPSDQFPPRTPTAPPTSHETPSLALNQQTGVLHEPKGHIKFWRQFQRLLTAYEPKCSPPLRLGSAESIRFEQADPDFSPELLDMLPEEVEVMKNAHTIFVQEILISAPKLHFAPGTKGLVSTAGGSYLPVLVISLRMLRRTGSELPMEVFLADSTEYEEYICDVVLPSLNARCVVLSHILDAVPKAIEIQKYQFKLFAMMFSSFEEILFLDADAFPLFAPESLFASEPFISNHLVTWPDFWASTVSPYYYEIASHPDPSAKKPIRQSSESGELLLSKKSHYKTLLLATYYNFWGPDFYYPLLSQGAAGEGDKETFLAAAITLSESFYQVSEPICALGHRTKTGLAGSAMAQFDPRGDHALTSKGEYRVKGSKAPPPKPFFIHANFPKFNPATVFDPDQAVTPTYADDGSYTRAWTIPEDVVSNMGFDVEKSFWKEIMWTACELENKFVSWRGRKGTCRTVRKYWNAMFAEGR